MNSSKQDRLRAEIQSIRAKIARLQTALSIKEQSLKRMSSNSRAAYHENR